MAMLILDSLSKRLDLSVLRENAKEGFSLKGKTVHFELSPATRGKMVLQGYAQYTINGRSWKTPVYGCLCDLKDGHQAISLKKAGSYLPEPLYRWLDERLGRCLNYIAPTLLGVNLEFTPPSEEKGEVVSRVINPGKWGRQSCQDFEWSQKAQELISQGARLHRWCSRCAKLDGCTLAAQLAANRR